MVTRDTSQHKFGSASFKIVTSAASQGARYAVSGLANSTTYTVSAWFYSATSVDIKLNLYRNDFGDVIQSSITTLSAGTWTKITATRATSATGTWGIVLPMVMSAGAQTIYVDGVQVEQKSYATPYVETNGATATRNAGRIQMPVNFFSSTNSWVSFRLRPEIVSGTPRVWKWAQDVNNNVELYWEKNLWHIRRTASGLSEEATEVWAGTAGTSVTVTGRFASSGPSISINGAAQQSQTFYDDFERADTSPGSLGTAPSGQSWSLTGTGYQNAHIENGRFVTDLNTYAYIQFPVTLTRMSGKFSYGAGDDTGSESLTLISSPDSGLFDNALHFTFGATNWAMQVRVNNVTSNLATGSYTSLSKDGTVYSVAMTIDATNNKVYIELPDGTFQTVTDSRVSSLAGPWSTWQITGQTGTGAKARWESVAGESTTPTANTGGGHVPIISSSSFDIGSDTGTSNWLDGEILWMAGGDGSLTDSDVTTLNGYGNTDPTMAQLKTLSSSTQQLVLWTADNTTLSISALPSVPTSLAQYKSDGSTAIASGNWTNESSVALKFMMSSINTTDSLTPQVEVREVGTNFSNAVTNSGDAVAYSGTAVQGIVNVTGLTSGKTYHWQARTSNATGAGSWVSMGGNPDFRVDTSNPISLSISSPTGYTKDDTRPTLIFKKASDSDSGISSYSVSLDSGKNRSFSTSGIPANGNGSSNYVWKDDNDVKVEFINENDSDSSNDEIHVYFKGLNTTELSEGKHTWTATANDNVSNSTSASADFYIDKTNPSISDLAVANVSTVLSGVSYNLDITNRMPSFSGLATDIYQGSTVTNSNGTKDTFDKVSSGPQTITLTFKKQKSDKTYADYSTKDFSLSDIQDINGDKKSTRFYVTTPFPLVDGYYQVTIVLKDSAGNSYSQPAFYLVLNVSKTTNPIQNLFTNNLETEIIKQETVPAVTEEEKELVKQNGYVVKVKVVDTNKKPIEGAKVTIHSKVQETVTNKDGIAEFKNVEAGEHKILIAYNNFEGEQTVNLTGDVKEFDFNIQVKEQNAFLNKQVILVIGIMAFIILVTVVLLIKAKQRGKP